MAVQRLSLTRDQFASFLQDFEQIKQFERLFSTVDTINTVTLDEINVSAGSAFAAANEALAQISGLSIQTELLALAPPDLGGTVTSVGLSGGTTGLTIATSTTNPITTSGTFTLGGTLVAVNGGTGFASYAVGDILFASTTTALSRLADVATGNALISGGVGVAPSYGKIGLTTHVSGTLPVANGGTNQTTYTDGQLLIGNTTGNTLAKATLTAGSGISITNGAGSITIDATGAGGTVTSVGGTGTVNGITLTGTVTTSGNLTLGGTLSGVSLTTQVSGVLPIANGGTNGTATPTAGGVAYGTGTAYAVNSAGTSGQVLTSAGVGAPTWTTPTTGTVTSVTGTAPVVSSGGSTPAISMAAATASVNGYLTSTDWTTFNSKGSGSVTSVSGTGTVNGITLTGTVTSSGSLTLGGTLSGVSLTTQVSGTLPVANGGTGVTISTGTGSVVLSNTPTLVTPILGVASATSIAAGLGLVGTPAYTFTGDLNTGIWSPAADTIAVSTAGAERVRVTSAGNVGLGTASPVAYAGYTALTIEGATSGAVLALRNTATTASVEIAATTAEGYFKTVGSLPLTLSTNNLERFRITAAGNIGIGTTAPTVKLTVIGGTSGFPSLGTASGGFFLSSSNGLYGLYAGIDDASGVAWLQEMRNDAATAYAISLNPSGGNIGIGTTAPAYQLQLSTDSAAKPTSALWTIASDSRVKTETGEYTKGLDAVCALRPITYQYNGAAGFTVDGKENISIVAQEAMQHFPECVGTFEALLNEGDEEKTELYNWNGHALTFALVNAIKELKASNDALTARVAQLEEK